MKKWIILILLILPFAVAQTQPAKVISDFRMIFNAGMEKKFFNRWESQFESAVKLEHNSEQIDEIDFDLNLYYKPVKYLTLGAGYRMAAKHKNNGEYKYKQRFSAELHFNKKISRLSVAYRLRYQNVDDDYTQYDAVYPSVNILRNRLLAAYDIKKCKLTPFVSSELYGQLSNLGPFIFKLNSALGLKYSMQSHSSFKLYLRIDTELNSEHPYTFYNLGVGYMYNFN